MGLSKLWAEFKAFAFQGNMIELAVAVVIGGAFGGVVHSLVGDVIMPTVAYLIHEGGQVAEKTKEAAVSVASKAGIATSHPATTQTTQPAAATAAASSPAPGAAPSPVPGAAPSPVPGAVVTSPGTAMRADAKLFVVTSVEAGRMSASEGATLLSAMTPPPAAPAPEAAPAPKPDETKPVAIDFSIGPVPVGKFITELINFLILAFAVFIMIVKLLGGVMKKMKTPEKPGEPTTRECPECLSIIPIKATRCSHCTAMVPPVTPTPAPA